MEEGSKKRKGIRSGAKEKKGKRQGKRGRKRRDSNDRGVGRGEKVVRVGEGLERRSEEVVMGLSENEVGIKAVERI